MLFTFWSKRLRPLVHTSFPSKIVSLWVSPKSKSTFCTHFPLVRRIGYQLILCISFKAIGRYHNLKKANLRVRPCVHNTAPLQLLNMNRNKPCTDWCKSCLFQKNASKANAAKLYKRRYWLQNVACEYSYSSESVGSPNTNIYIHSDMTMEHFSIAICSLTKRKCMDRAKERAEKQSTYNSGDAEKTDIKRRKRTDINSKSRTDTVF